MDDEDIDHENSNNGEPPSFVIRRLSNITLFDQKEIYEFDDDDADDDDNDDDDKDNDNNNDEICKYQYNNYYDDRTVS